MEIVKVALITAPIAAYITSFIEYKKDYNLYDFTLDAIRGVLAKILSGGNEHKAE